MVTQQQLNELITILCMYGKVSPGWGYTQAKIYPNIEVEVNGEKSECGDKMEYYTIEEIYGDNVGIAVYEDNTIQYMGNSFRVLEYEHFYNGKLTHNDKQLNVVFTEHLMDILLEKLREKYGYRK